MKTFEIKGEISPSFLKKAFRDKNMIKSKVEMFFIILLPMVTILFTIQLLSWKIYWAAFHCAFVLIAVFLFIFLSDYFIVPKLNAKLAFEIVKKRNGNRTSYERTFTIRESYIYSRWEEDSEETELGQILKLESFKEHLFIWIGFLDPVSESNHRVKLKRRLCIVRKDAFIQGSAKELYDHLKETYLQMKFSPWRDGKKRVL